MKSVSELFSTGEKVALSVKCMDLPPSPTGYFCELFSSSGGQFTAMTLLGRSQVVTTPTSTHNSWVFSPHFTLDFNFGQTQLFKVHVLTASTNTFCGEAAFTLGSLLSAKLQTLPFSLLSNATLMVRALPAPLLDPRSKLVVTFGARNLDAKDGILGLGNSSDPFFILTAINTDKKQFQDVYQSEVINKNLNPVWTPATIPLDVLKDTTQLNVAIWDKDFDRGNDLIGSCQFTLLDILKEHKQLPVLNYKQKNKQSGVLDVVHKEIRDCPPHFTDFLFGGSKIQFQLVVDFSLGNGPIGHPSSKHYGEGRVGNVYLECMNVFAGPLLEFNTELVDAFGVGATDTKYFSLSSSGDSVVVGMSGLVHAYSQVFPQLTSADSVFLGPVLSHCVSLSRRDPESYTVLVLLLNGKSKVADKQDAVDALVLAARHAPLSIVVAIVDDDVSKHAEWLHTANTTWVSRAGEKMCRSMIQCVKVIDPKTLLSTLSNIPGQALEYFHLKNVRPNAPPPPSAQEEEVEVDTATSEGLVGREILEMAFSM